MCLCPQLLGRPRQKDHFESRSLWPALENTARSCINQSRIPNKQNMMGTQRSCIVAAEEKAPFNSTHSQASLRSQNHVGPTAPSNAISVHLRGDTQLSEQTQEGMPLSLSQQSKQVIRNLALALTLAVSLGQHPQHCRSSQGWAWKLVPWIEQRRRKAADARFLQVLTIYKYIHLLSYIQFIVQMTLCIHGAGKCIHLNFSQLSHTAHMYRQ